MSDRRTDWRPTHRVPPDGLDAWSEPDVAHPAQALDPGLEVRVVDARGDWTRVRCSNGWSTWVDGRLLEPLTGESPPMLVPAALAAAMEDGLRSCVQAMDDYEAGLLDEAGLQDRLVGGGVLRYEDAVWLLDLDGGTWWRYDGIELRRMDEVGDGRER